ncbi:MAG: hypothetical protein QNK89_06990 [Lacinutrix sp.]|uniref:hypothetical protein n=1 Tax=Lacinutrix sp. TaxID=1937692 RepID=UPI0030A770C0
MKKFTLTLSCILFIIIAFSQAKFNASGYNVTNDELTIKTFSKDSTANALVIYEY